MRDETRFVRININISHRDKNGEYGVKSVNGPKGTIIKYKNIIKNKEEGDAMIECYFMPLKAFLVMASWMSFQRDSMIKSTKMGHRGNPTRVPWKKWKKEMGTIDEYI